MLATVLENQDTLLIKDINDQPLKNNEVKVEVKAAGICGSEIHKLQTQWKYGFPSVMGHEFSGQVVAVGRDVKSFNIGDKVAGLPFLPCFSCIFCEEGHYSLCDNYKMIGHHFQGAFAEKVNMPERNLIKVNNITYEEAAMLEPVAIAIHAVKGIDPSFGDTVIVFGAGTIGLLVMQILKLAGIYSVTMVDIIDEKLSFAKKLGADSVINSKNDNLEEAVEHITGGLGVDIVMECAGTPITQEQSLRVAKKSGKVGYVGIAYQDVIFREDSFERIFRHELTVKGFWNAYSAPFPGKEWTAAVKLIRDKKIKLHDLISHRYPLEKGPEAFEMILSKKEKYNKVMIKPNM